MKLTQGEYTQFSLRGRMYLLKEFGVLLKENFFNKTQVEVYSLYDFYVEVLYQNDSAIKAEPVLFSGIMSYYN